MSKTVTFQGKTYTFPDDATPQQIAEALEAYAAPKKPVGVGEDISRSFVAGSQQGVTGLIGLPGDVDQGMRDLSQTGFGDLIRKAYDPENKYGKPAPSKTNLLTSEGLNEFVGKWGDGSGQYEPQTVPGEYARTTGNFATSALIGKGSLGVRGARVVVPAVASETAGQITKGTPAEPVARIAAALAAGGAYESGLRKSGVVEAERAAARAPRQAAMDSERKFGPLTEGERSGNAGIRLAEDDLRRGTGKARATMAKFDADRAKILRDRVMDVVTRGKQAISQNVGEAGTVLADKLRSNRTQIRSIGQQQYDEAFEMAKAEAVAPSDAMMSRVLDEAAEYGFELPGNAKTTLENLHRQMMEGTATQANVERARQMLNRNRSSAINSRDDATEFVYDRIIDALDDWRAGTITNPQAQKSMTEARAIFAEGQKLYTPQGRFEMSDGNIGRIDTGGRAIDKVINADLTGEQIIDSMIGAGTKPSQQALGAVKRIKDMATQTIVYTKKNAASGTRLPGRQKVGGRTAGERKFAADDPNAPGGTELPNDELQALREGVAHRLLSPLDDYIGRVESQGDIGGGLLPVQRLSTQLDNLLNKGGREIAEIIYTPRELADLRAAKAHLDRIIPPPGAAFSGTNPAFQRMLSNWFDQWVGVLPGIGPAVREAVMDGNAARAARKAVAPATQMPPPRTISPPSRVAAPYAAVQSQSYESPNDDSGPAVQGRATMRADLSNEQRVRGMLEPGNLDLASRPVVDNGDGTQSTVWSMSIGTPDGEVLIPRVSDDGRVLTEEEAIALFRQTGQHLGLFRDAQSATAYAERLHKAQAAQYGR